MTLSGGRAKRPPAGNMVQLQTGTVRENKQAVLLVINR